MTNQKQEKQKELIELALNLNFNPHQIAKIDRQGRSGKFWNFYFRLETTSAPADSELEYIIKKEKARLQKILKLA